MPYPFPPDLQSLVSKQMASGRYASEDELLRKALRALAEEEEDLDAICESLAEWAAGDPGLPLEDAFAAVRAKHGLGESR
jgi:putative addiction module CopG family antidote